MAAKPSFNWTRLLAGIGVAHYLISVLLWSLTVWVLVRQGGGRWGYVAVRAIPCVAVFGAFLVAFVISKRHRRGARYLVFILLLISVSWCAIDIYRQDYQIGMMTYEHGCKHLWNTWWWWNG